MKLDKTTLADLRLRMDAALAPLAQELGIQIKTGNCTYDRTGSNAVFKVECCAVSASGMTMTKEATAFVANARFYGLVPEDLGRTFTFACRTYKLVGFLTRGRFPFLGEYEGRRYKLPEEAVRGLRKAPAPVPAGQ